MELFDIATTLQEKITKKSKASADKSDIQKVYPRCKLTSNIIYLFQLFGNQPRGLGGVGASARFAHY